VVIPKEIRHNRGWTAGTVLAVEEQGDVILLRSVPTFPVTTLDELLGCLPYAGRAKSQEEMDTGIARGARCTGGRSRYGGRPGSRLGSRRSGSR
jgi:bifunctional DNA-binding transcriptional regulator/antitoxin component of YhaV-PrlF toxin-antitoxin module